MNGKQPGRKYGPAPKGGPRPSVAKVRREKTVDTTRRGYTPPKGRATPKRPR